jgi:hypothetical protein
MKWAVSEEITSSYEVSSPFNTLETSKTPKAKAYRTKAHFTEDIPNRLQLGNTS